MTFQSWNAAVEAADQLELAGYEVVISNDVIDPYSGAACAEAYKIVADKAAEDSCWAEVDRIIDPLDGNIDELGEAGADHVPFSSFMSAYKNKTR